MDKSDKRFFVTGGGTGGHIYPAVAVADVLKTQGKVYYIGNPENLEFDIVTKKGYDFLPVNVHGMPRKAGLELIKWFVQLGFAVINCLFYIKKYKPDVVFGTGGYVSAPGMIAAKMSNVPFVMHDCDANPGLVTRKLAQFASGVSLAFECAKKYIKNNNCQINGNPLRAEFKTITQEDARKTLGLQNKLTLCIMGGSQGAKSINEASVKILKELSKDYDMQVIFQTGKKKFQDVETALKEVYPTYSNDKNIIVKPYFDDMVTVLKASDIAVSRAGSLSISELCASDVATIFVPYPHAAADHQRKNAKFMEQQGAGLYLEDSDVEPEILLKMLSDLTKDNDKLLSLKSSAANLAKLNGTEEIVKQINACIR